MINSFLFLAATQATPPGACARVRVPHGGIDKRKTENKKRLKHAENLLKIANKALAMQGKGKYTGK